MVNMSKLIIEFVLAKTACNWSIPLDNKIKTLIFKTAKKTYKLCIYYQTEHADKT